MKKNEQFERKGRDLHTTLHVSLREALLGFTKQVSLKQPSFAPGFALLSPLGLAASLPLLTRVALARSVDQSPRWPHCHHQA